MEAVPGYLSLHQSAESLTLKWTPNQLMNGTLGDSELELGGSELGRNGAAAPAWGTPPPSHIHRFLFSGKQSGGEFS